MRCSETIQASGSRSAIGSRYAAVLIGNDPGMSGRVTPERFLVDHEARFPWQLSDAPAALRLEPLDGFTGRGAHPLEVALATVVGASARR